MEQNVEQDKVAKAIAGFSPLLEALILTAERTGASGEQKREAVAEGAEMLWGSLQSSVKEIRGIPWAAVAPIVAPAVGGLIDAIVAIFNRAVGHVWGWFGAIMGGDDE